MFYEHYISYLCNPIAYLAEKKKLKKKKKKKKKKNPDLPTHFLQTCYSKQNFYFFYFFIFIFFIFFFFFFGGGGGPSEKIHQDDTVYLQNVVNCYVV